MSVYAQAGWGKSNRIIRGLNDGSINGVIWSPKDEFPSSMRADIRIYKRDFPHSVMLFDPQFYTTILVGTKNRCLQHYPYWQILTRSSFSNSSNVSRFVQETLDYQCNLNVDRLLTPSIKIDSFGSVDCRISLNLANESISYYNTLVNSGQDLQPLLISLIISEAALSSPSNFDQFLDEISIFSASGFYLIVDREDINYKATFEPNGLENLLYLIYILAEVNSYEVICGYGDFIGMLLCAVGAKAVGTGWYNNLRQFTMGRFLPSPPRRQASPRCSSLPLINSILLDEMDIINARGQLNSILSGTTYDAAFTGATNPSNIPWVLDESTLHHWLVLQRLIASTTGGTIQSNIDNCLLMISNAQTAYNSLRGVMPFTLYTGDHHLQQWQSAITNFRNRVSI